jgi:hypothetical protein
MDGHFNSWVSGEEWELMPTTFGYARECGVFVFVCFAIMSVSRQYDFNFINCPHMLTHTQSTRVRK